MEHANNFTSIDKLRSRGIKLWFVETSTFNFTWNLALGLINAFLIKILGYGVVELGLLTSVRIASIGLSQFPAAILISFKREKRKLIWFVTGAMSRLSLPLIVLAPYLPAEYRLLYLVLINFEAQFTVGLSGVAASDVLADLVPYSMSADVFSTANKLNYIGIASANLVSLAIFIAPLPIEAKYLYSYGTAFAVGAVSTVALALIPDPGPRPPSTLPQGFMGMVISSLVRDKAASRYLMVLSFFNFAVNIPAPFWDYIVMSLTGGSELFIILKNVSNLFVKAFSVRLWRDYLVKRGLKQTVVVGFAFTSFIPVFYAVVGGAEAPAELLGAEAFSGMAWASLDISMTLYNLYLPPNNARPIFLSAIGFTVNTVSSIASTLGTAIYVSTNSVLPVLLTSSALRLVTALVAKEVLPDIGKERVMENQVVGR
mgnify:CR=1 FL=1